jgi:DNA-directed RNA polymerase beta' subunit
MSQEIFYNKTINKKELKSIIHSIFQSYGIINTSHLTENFKKSGFTFATQAGISISIEDLKVPPTKDNLFSKNNNSVKRSYYFEKRGAINPVERFQKIIDIWHTTSEILKHQLVDYFKAIDPLNPVYMMAFSGARGNLSQVRQLVGMRGLMSDPSGQIIDSPIKTNFREGLSITDYVISSYGARKGIVDTALKTADSGYLTRRLVDVAQHVIIREFDCKTKNGVSSLYHNEYSVDDQYIGRVLAKTVKDPITQKSIIDKNTPLTKINLDLINFPSNLILRSPLLCESSRSICQKCYGWNLAQGQLVDLADAIGIIAAQSIGEPGTQLTMRTFHTGGVFTGESNNQIRSICDGQVLYSSKFRGEIFRTSYGEIILKANNTSELFILNSAKKVLNRFILMSGMLVFAPNKSFIQNGDLIAEVPLLNQRTTSRIKKIFSEGGGEVQFQNIVVSQQKSIFSNGLLWVATGQIYDVLPNMFLKTKENTVVKNSSLAQTRLVSRVSGIVKSIAKTNSIAKYLVNSLVTFATQSLKKNAEGIVFLLGTKKDFFLFGGSFEDKRLGVQNTLQRKTRKYTMSFSHNFYYSRYKISNKGKINSLSLFILEPLEINNLPNDIKILSPNNIHTIDNTIINQNLNKKIFYPGEIIDCYHFRNGHSCINIKILSYCHVFKINEDSLSIIFCPLIQLVVPKSGYSISFPSVLAFKKMPRSTFITSQNKSKITAGYPLAEIFFELFNSSNNLMDKPVLKCLKSADSNWKRFSLFHVINLPINFLKGNAKKMQISYLIKNNRAVQSYSVLATINFISTQKTVIKDVKNLKNNPTRFLLTTSLNYKSYKYSKNEKIKESNFLLIGDKLGKTKVSHYSGYKIPNYDKSYIKIRISSPFFVSVGTRIITKHGSLVQDDNALFQVSYTRVLSSDIVTGLPRVEQLLESRPAKNPCQLVIRPCLVKTKSSAILRVLESDRIRIYNLDVPLIIEGILLGIAQPLDSGFINPHEVLDLYFDYYNLMYTLDTAAKRSIVNTQILLVNLIQNVYKSQGIYISNKHIEIIICQVTSKVKINPLQTSLKLQLREILELDQILQMNSALVSTGKLIIEYEPILMGITKVSLTTDSFISAASFQETTRVLTKAAIEGKVEWLRGLKENVILGRLIPAGTGFTACTSLSLLNIKLEGEN